MTADLGDTEWRKLLARPPRASHLVQIYDSDTFLAGAVAHFATQGLHRGEAVLLYGTRTHLAAIAARLRQSGADVQGAMRSGQLSVCDVQEALWAIAPYGTVDPERYRSVAGAALDRASSDPRYCGVRWWGEMAGTLYHGGNRDAALVAEQCADSLNRKHGAALLCSFLCDGFDARSYEVMLRDMSCAHTELIPCEDYTQHRVAVNRAIAEVVGEIDGPLLRSLWAWKGRQCRVPSSQALLFWLREALPEHFEAVVARAKAYHIQQECKEQDRVFLQ